MASIALKRPERNRERSSSPVLCAKLDVRVSAKLELSYPMTDQIQELGVVCLATRTAPEIRYETIVDRSAGVEWMPGTQYLVLLHAMLVARDSYLIVIQAKSESYLSR